MGGVMKNLKTFIMFSTFLSLIGIMTACGDRSGRTLETTTARQVNDQQSLKNFVLDARNYLEKNYEQAVEDFRKEGGPWRYEEVYLFIIDETGRVLLHVGIPAFEGQQHLLMKDLSTGEFIVDGLIREGTKRGGGFVEYRFDNPSTEERESSRKITYVTPFSKSENEPTLIVGAGFFPDDN